MSKKTAKGLASRFGARYGRTVRKRLAEIEVDLRKKHTCQSCGNRSVKRVSVGVWKCAKCGFTFAGGAYSPTSKVGQEAKRSIRKEITS